MISAIRYNYNISSVIHCLPFVISSNVIIDVSVFAMMGSSDGIALCEMNKTVLELNISPNDILSSCVPDSLCLCLVIYLFQCCVSFYFLNNYALVYRF